MRYACLRCGYVYDPRKGDADQGVAPGTPGEALPPEWRCPMCTAPQDDFAGMEEEDE